MAAQRITAEQLQSQWQAELKQLAEEIADAINHARAGRIIADTEERVRDAHAVFRQKAYQHALDLLQNQREAFSPSTHPADLDLEEQGPADRLAPDGQRPH